MEAPFVRKHCFSDVCEAGQVKSGSSSSSKHTSGDAKSNERELIMAYIYIFIKCFEGFSRLKLSGLMESSLQTGRIPQTLLEMFHNHFIPAEAPEHQINQRWFHQPHIFGVWSADLTVQWNHSLYHSHPRLIPQREYPSDILGVYLNWLLLLAVEAKEKRWNRGGNESRHKKKRTYLKLWITGAKDAIS